MAEDSAASSGVPEASQAKENGPTTTANGDGDGMKPPKAASTQEEESEGSVLEEGEIFQDSDELAKADAAASNGDTPALLAKVLAAAEALPFKEQAKIHANVERCQTYPVQLPLSDTWNMLFSNTSEAAKTHLAGRGTNGNTSTLFADTGGTLFSTIFECSTVPGLCGSLAALRRALSTPVGRNKGSGMAGLKQGSNLHFFRQGVKPAWEDPANAKGGRVTLSPPPPGGMGSIGAPPGPSAFDKAFEACVLLLAGSALEDAIEAALVESTSPASKTTGRILGVVGNRRARGDRIEVWVGGTDGGAPGSEWVEKLGEQLGLLMDMPECKPGRYKKHF